MDPNAPLAFAAGLVAFSSPCCLPLLPGYIAFISDLSADVHESESRRRVVIGASLFVLGFSVVFTALGATASLLGSFLLDNRQLFFRASGVFLVAMGLAMLVGAQIPFLSRMARSDLSRMRRGPVGAFPLGMAFAFGWTPCVGPVLAGLLTYAGATGSLIDGAGLLFVYSLGLGLPFIGAALLYRRAAVSFAWLRRYGGVINRAGGVILIVMGVLLFTGSWTALFAPVLRWYARFGWPPI